MRPAPVSAAFTITGDIVISVADQKLVCNLATAAMLCGVVEHTLDQAQAALGALVRQEEASRQPPTVEPPSAEEADVTG